MKKPITNMDDYAELMAKHLRTLRHFERCLFSVWCADHLLTSHAEHLEENMSELDLRTLQEIVNDLWDSLLGGVIPETDQLNALDMEFMGNNDEWSAPMKDIHPAVSIVKQSIGMCILCCRRNDVGLAQTIAQLVIDCVECTLEENGPSFSPDTLFEHPQIQHELETQLAMIKHLKGEYDLDSNLRMMFR
ncbi:DUF416 family protein [Gimesia sp.]|uniref:DUF416 family protein n=1 Tax=Gimesia sp. TaxID=2024833 RepID=UPI0025B90781|nr:DUF416 family protein [Gimesia sp.]